VGRGNKKRKGVGPRGGGKRGDQNLNPVVARTEGLFKGGGEGKRSQGAQSIERGGGKRWGKREMHIKNRGTFKNKKVELK